MVTRGAGGTCNFFHTRTNYIQTYYEFYFVWIGSRVQERYRTAKWMTQELYLDKI